ncbi:cysteine desulfurase [bacterium]|nr:cysteine desulfurase [bacterium]
MQKRRYLDNAATTPPDPKVIEAMTSCLAENWGNPSSAHQFGHDAKMALETARKEIAALAHCEADEVYFTSGGTEADNWALQGVLSLQPDSKRHIVISSFEHHAVIDQARQLEKLGAAVTQVPVSASGFVDASAVNQAITSQTCMVSVMHVNNELGTIQPIGEIGRLCQTRGVLFHTDAVQSFGKLDFRFNELSVQLASISAHKIYGPKGIGALLIKRGTRLGARSFGGSQERGQRTGTENMPGIVGFGEAAKLCRVLREEEGARIRGLRDQCETRLLEAIPDLIVNGKGGNRADAILSLRVPGCDGEELMIALDMRGLCVSTGAACSAGARGASHVLTALGLSVKDARSSLRISFGRFSTMEDVDALCETLPTIVKQQRENSIATVT